MRPTGEVVVLPRKSFTTYTVGAETTEPFSLPFSQITVVRNYIQNDTFMTLEYREYREYRKKYLRNLHNITNRCSGYYSTIKENEERSSKLSYSVTPTFPLKFTTTV